MMFPKSRKAELNWFYPQVLGWFGPLHQPSQEKEISLLRLRPHPSGTCMQLWAEPALQGFVCFQGFSPSAPHLPGSASTPSPWPYSHIHLNKDRPLLKAIPKIRVPFVLFSLIYWCLFLCIWLALYLLCWSPRSLFKQMSTKKGETNQTNTKLSENKTKKSADLLPVMKFPKKRESRAVWVGVSIFQASDQGLP